MEELKPLVSVGIPTFNRPDGLRRTLKCITNQTYSNLEIIVSDNCSPSFETESVTKEFSKNDSRIKFFRQSDNIGALSNFKFVLEQSTGDYFMWAADDDEWLPDFIKKMISIIGTRSAAFCNYQVKQLDLNIIHDVKIFNSGQGNTLYEKARSNLKERVPSMFYSLYKRKDIQWFLKYDLVFDWIDCYVMFKIILLDHGIALSKETLYSAGVSGTAYEYKPVKKQSNKLFTYLPYFIECCKVVFKSKTSLLEKFKLTVYLLEVNFRSFLVLEGARKNFKLFSILYRFYKWFTPNISIQRLY
jgi:glycosyltransferase involved in cell wall biosynthesis